MRLRFKYASVKINEPWEKPADASWPQILDVDASTRRLLIAWSEEVNDDAEPENDA